jgi:hypothetical protein
VGKFFLQQFIFIFFVFFLSLLLNQVCLLLILLFVFLGDGVDELNVELGREFDHETTVDVIGENRFYLLEGQICSVVQFGR